MASTIAQVYIGNVSTSGSVYITDDRPVISWLFEGQNVVGLSDPPQEVNNVDQESQTDFELRIGTSSANLGGSSFVGNIASTGTYESSRQSWRYTGFDLERGTHYYGQVRCRDEGNEWTTWKVFHFRFNVRPTVSEIDIEPMSPVANDSLTVNYTFEDEDGHEEGNSKVRWFRNGVHERWLDGRVEVGGEYVKTGDEWVVQVTPYDGYEYGDTVTSMSVTVVATTTEHPVSHAKILPENPTTLDPLYAFYQYNGNDDVSIAWFINDVQVTAANNKRFYRFDLNSGDEVNFVVSLANGGSSSGAQAETVTILAATHRVFNIRINGEAEPLEVPNQSPVLSWDVISPDEELPRFVNLKIGYARGSGEIYDQVIGVAENELVIPPGLLKFGEDYYVTLSTGATETGLGPEAYAHFRLVTSLWANTVSNSTGWTVEATLGVTQFRTDAGALDDDKNSALYQGIRVADGHYFAEIRFYCDKLEVVSQTSTNVAVNLSSPSLYTVTITGQNANLKVYVNGSLEISFTLDQTTNDKYVEFGSLVDTSEAKWAAFSYTTEGVKTPGGESYDAVNFNEIFSLSQREITDIATWQDKAIVATVSPNNEAEYFIYKPFVNAKTLPTASRTYSPINDIVSSPNGKYTYFAHANGATYLKSKPVVKYDHKLHLNWQQPDLHGWTRFISDTVVHEEPNGGSLTIDTSDTGGVWYYSQQQHGSVWYERVDNNKGWTVDFTLQVDKVNQESLPVNTSSPHGFGVMVSDGKFYETVNFFTNEIVLASSNVSATYDTTSVNNYRLAGKGNLIELWGKTEAAATYTLLSRGEMTYRSTEEGNAGKPSFAGYHAVWHDDGKNGGRQIYCSKFLEGGCTVPEVIVPREFNASNPKIAYANDRAYVVFEQRYSEYTTIGIVIKNSNGWGKPTTLLDGGHDCKNPHVAVDSNGRIHVVWEDYRNITTAIRWMQLDTDGVWGEDQVVSSSDTDCYHPSIHALSSRLAVVWTQNIDDSRTSIYYRALNLTTDEWYSSYEVSDSSTENADYPDVVLYSTFAHVVWQDDHSGNEQIYARKRQNTGAAVAGAAGNIFALTSDDHASRFPSVGASDNSVLVVYERDSILGEYGGDIPVGQEISDIYASVYTIGSSTWYSENVLFVFDDTRNAYRPAVDKTLSNYSAFVLYEAADTNELVEYIDDNRNFVEIRSLEYMYDLAETYSVTDTLDDQVSGKLPRKEIRFGDFSNAYKGTMIVKDFAFYCGENVEPYQIGIVSTSNSPAKDDRSFGVLPNNNGDAWIASQTGLGLFLRTSNKLVLVDNNDSDIKNQPIHAVAIDRDGTLLVGSENKLYRSADHISFTLFHTIDGDATVSDIVAGNDDLVWVAMRTEDEVDQEIICFSRDSNQTLIKSSSFGLSQSDGLPSGNINCLEIDADGILWIGTDNGLAKYDGIIVTVYNTENSGIGSNIVNSIALRGTNQRYLGTASGVYQMTGNRILRLTGEKTRWNNNVKSVSFQAPNTLWASSLSDICQIQLDDETGNHAVLVYGLSSYAPNAVAYDNLRTYFVQSPVQADLDNAVESQKSRAYLEVLVNGRRADFGYQISNDNSAIQFESPLKSYDVVQVVWHNELIAHTSLSQNRAEVDAIGKKDSRIDEIAVVEYNQESTSGELVSSQSLVYAKGTQGDSEYLFVHDAQKDESTSLPFDQIVLDTTPPTGTVAIAKQIDRYRLQLDISGYDELSGVSQMVVSNFSNATTNGSTASTPVDFATQFIHTLDTSLDSVVQVHDFTGASYSGAKIVRWRISDDSNLYYVGTKNSARILKYNTDTSSFDVAAVLDTNVAAAIEFMVVFKNKLYVGVGKTGGSAKIMYSSDGTTWKTLASVAAQHVYAACVGFDELWVGDSAGRLYSYSGGDPNIDPMELRAETNEDVIYAVESANGKIYMATGSQGNLVSYDVFNDSQEIAYTDPDPNLTSLDVLTTNGFVLFVGTGSRGAIMSRTVRGGVFETSYQYLASKIKAIKIDDAALRFCAANKMWEATSSPSFSGWKPFATFEEDVEDFVPSITSGSIGDINVWVVTASGVFTVRQPSSQKFVYLQLIDNAGNKSPDGSIFDSIALSDLVGYVNQNRIMKIDTSGQLLDYVDGTAPFYTAQKVEQETGEFYSEVFFGTNNLIGWDMLTFDCETPTGTEVTIELRTANSRDAVLLTDWQASYDSNYKAGVNIAFLTGKYIQFRAILKSTVAGSTPTLRSVSIRSKTSEATHFYTTNFILGKKIKSGLLTAQKIVPVAADVIFGFNTTNSTDWGDYQEITPDKIFVADETQTGTGVRVGIKFITPTPADYVTDTIPEYEYGEYVFVNTIGFDHSDEGDWGYRITFYTDSSRTQEEYVASTEDDVTGWTVDGTALAEGGVTIGAAETKSLMFVPSGETTLVCNKTYYVTVEAYDRVNETYTTLDEAHIFVSGCNTTFVDTISFDHTATTTANYQFRVRLYSDPERTELYKVYYTQTNASYFEADYLDFVGTGLAMGVGDNSLITLTPPSDDMEAGAIYHLVIDAFNGTEFEGENRSYTFRVSDPTADTTCGEYTGVPIVQRFAFTFTLEDGTQVLLMQN